MANIFGINDSRYNDSYKNAAGTASKLKEARLKRFKKLQEEQEEEAKKQSAVEASKGGVKPGSNDERNWLKKGYDQLNIIDSGRTFKNGTPSKEGSKKNSLEQLGDTGRAMLSGTAKIANSTGELGRESVELGRAIAARATGNKKAEKAAIKRGLDSDQSYAGKDGGFLGVGGIIDDEDLQNASVKDIVKASAGTGLESAGEILPGAKVFKGGRLARTGKGLLEGGAIAGVGDVGGQLLDEEEGIDLKQTAQSMAIGGLLSGTVHGVGKADKAPVKEKATPGKFDNTTPEGLTDDPSGLAELNKAMGERDYSNSQTPVDESRLLPERAGGDPVRTLDEVDAEINDLQVNGDVNSTTPEIKARFAALQAERKIAAANETERGFTLRREEKAAFEDNGLPNDPTEAKAALDSFDNGEMGAPMKYDDPVTDAKDIFAHSNMPEELKAPAFQLATDRSDVEEALSKLMTDEKADGIYKQLDAGYKERLAEIDEMPPARQELEYQKLEDNYQKSLDDIETKKAEDAGRIDEMHLVIAHLSDKEKQLVDDANMLIRESPDDFKSIDEQEALSQRDSLEDNLTQAERFNNSEKIVKEVAESPDPVTAVKSEPEALEAVTKELETHTKTLPGFKNLDGRVTQSLLKVMSPSQILDKMGQSRIFAGLVKAEAKINVVNEADAKTITSIVERLKGNKQLQEQIIDYLQGSRKTLSAADEETAAMIRTFLDEKRVGLEKLGVGTLDDYFPQMVDKNNPEAVKLFQTKPNGEISFGNFKKRMGNDGDYNKDIGEVLALYASGYNKKVHLEPALKPLEDIKFQDKISQEEVDWVEAYTKQLIGANRGGLEKAFDTALGKGTYRKALGFQRMASAVATMGFNPGTAVRNTTQVINTVADIGPRYAKQGAMDGLRAFRAGPNSPEWKELIEAGIMDGGVSHNYYDDINATVNLKGKIESKSTNFAKAAMGAIRATDVGLRAQAYYGAKALGHSKGLTGQELQDFAINKVANGQFITSKIDMPIAFNGPGMRSLTQLATFTGKQAGFLSRMGVKMVKGEDGFFTPQHAKDFGSVMAAVASAALATETLKPVMGFNEKEWIPFYDQFAPYVPDAIADKVGIDKERAGDGVYRSPLVSFLAGNGKGKTGLLGALQTGDIGGFAEDQRSAVIPGGTQAKKSYEGFKTTDEGVSKNSEGKVRFLQDMGVTDKIKSTIFGQYATKGGQDWIKAGFPTLSDSQMRLGSEEGSGDVTFEQLPREKQKVFYDYYTTAKKVTGRDNAIDAIKDAARQGDQNKANRLGKEFNDKVTKSMQNYWKKHDDLPEELQDKMVNDLYVDVQKQIDKATE